MRRGTRNEYERSLLRLLKIERDAGSQGSGLVYRNAADFVLQHGVWYEPAPLPAGVEPGMPKMCYGNAITLAATHGWEYVEGFAILPEPLSAIAIPHAWVALEGAAIDNTWRTMGTAYIGVAFSPERGHDATWTGDACVLDDWKRRWPLFRTRWQGEDYTLQWPGTEVIEMMRRNDHEAALQWLEEHAGELETAESAE